MARPLLLALGIGLAGLGLLAPAVTPSELLAGSALEGADESQVLADGGVPASSVAPQPEELLDALPPLAPRQETDQPAGIGGNPAYTRLLTRLVAQNEPSPAHVAEALRQYYVESGMNGPDSVAGFDENSTLSFSFTVGDVTGDRFEDIALDVYCLDLVKCAGPRSSFSNPADYVTQFVKGGTCGYPHRVFLVSGTDGATVWDRALDLPAPIEGTPYNMPALNSCAQEFLVGKAPLSDGRTGLVLYRQVVTRAFPNVNAAIRLEHEVYVIDARDGAKVWNFRETGLFFVGVNSAHGRNLLINPILQVPPTEGTAWVPGATQPSLHVQGVSFDIVFADTRVPVPGMFAPYPILDAYWPDEWAARLDLTKGDVLWRKATFTKDLATSVVPELLHALPTPHPFLPATATPDFRSARYWTSHPCCWDLTGDGVPDLLYTTHEWSTTPSLNPDGLHFLGSRAVLVDGESGDRKYSVEVGRQGLEHWRCQPALPYCLMVFPQALGDATGDGISDFLVHVEDHNWDYWHNYTVHDGTTGEVLWGHAGRRNLELLVLGDGNGDGGNDALQFEWFNGGPWGLNPASYDQANVTRTPLVLLNGRDGASVWRADSFIAPVDLSIVFDAFRVNGVPDLDADGVGDFPVDDPVYYPDQTVVHRQTFLSGRDAAPLRRLATVGAFSVPSHAADLTGDGVDDLGVLSGDVTDLWITTYDGATGDALWSRRVLATRVSSYNSATARIRYHPLAVGEGPAQDFLLNIHFRVFTEAGFFATVTNTPQLTVYKAVNGSAEWAIPELPDQDLKAVIPGPTPLSAAFERAYWDPPVAKTLTTEALPLRAGLGMALFAACALLGFGLTQRRRSP